MSDEEFQLVGSCTVLRDDGSLGSCRYGAVLCQETGIASHHLNEEDAFVAVGRVADFVHALHDCVQCGVVAYGQVRAVQVVVYRAGQTYARHVKLFGKDASAGKASVAANYHQGVYVVGHHVVVGLLSALCRLELLASGRLQYGASALDDVAHVLCGKLLYLVVHQSFVATVDGFHLHVVCYGGTCHRTYCCIHAWRVASGGQNAYGLYSWHSSDVYMNGSLFRMQIYKEVPRHPSICHAF